MSVDTSKKKSLALPPSHLMACPNCGSDCKSGFDPESLACKTCQLSHFSLGAVPCLFPSGVHHRAIWQHQLGLLQAQAQQGLAQLQEAASRYDVTDTTRLRLADAYEAVASSQATTLKLMEEAGLTPAMNEQLGQVDPSGLVEYYDLALRDWGWDDQPSTYFDVNENNAALQRALSVLDEDAPAPKNILVIGAGAGRLSWDLHKSLAPGCTVALDSNPLSLVIAHKLIREQSEIHLTELPVFPQIDRPTAMSWTLPPPSDKKRLRDSWFAMGADAWRMPFRPASFDLIVTPWFIDVNGGDVRDLIGLISQLLTPKGRWLNTGPLLFTRHLPLHYKYQDSEIREFLTLAGFEVEKERVDLAAHLISPLEERARHEQLWTFCARGPDAPSAGAPIEGVEAPWLIMHHLPVADRNLESAQKHPLIDAILSLVDGKRSINQISHIVAPHIPEGIAAKDAVVTLLGQILSQRSGPA